MTSVTDPVTTTTTTTTMTTENNTSPLSDEKETNRKRLQEKMNMLKTRRTGIERRKQVEAYKTKQLANKKKPKNVMKTMAKDTIRQCLERFGVTDPAIEQSIMNEIAIGHLKTPTQIAESIVRRLQILMPNGPQRRGNNENKSEVPNNTTNENNNSSEVPNNTTNENNNSSEVPNNTNENNNSGEVPPPRKILKRPSQNLVDVSVPPPKLPDVSATVSTKATNEASSTTTNK
jgi:hypothetical protein